MGRLRGVSSSTRSRYAGRRGQQQKRWWRRLLTPGWLITAVLVVAFSYFAFTFLAPWQLNKDDALVARNEQIEAAYATDPVPVTEVVDENGSITQEQEWTRVSATGRYLAEDEVLLRLRPVEKTPAFQSLVPFQLDSGETLLVHRGWVASGDGVTVPEFAAPPAGAVTLQGMLRLGEPAGTKAPLQEQGFAQVYTISTEEISDLTGTDLGNDYIQLGPDQPGGLNTMPVPMLDRGNHLSYGLQWLAFGVMAPLGLIYFVWAEFKERRRARDEQDEMAEAFAAEASGEDTGDGSERDEDAWLESDPDVHTVVRSRNVRDRYGDTKRDHYEGFAKRERERY